MRVIWWLFDPCALLLLYIFMAKLMWWAGEHENFGEIKSEDEYALTELSADIVPANDKGTAHRARGSYMEDCQ